VLSKTIESKDHL